MNSTLYVADGLTHLKIITLSNVLAMIVIATSLRARIA